MSGPTAQPARKENAQAANAMITVALALLAAAAVYEILASAIVLLR